jgi:hypothetical protein
MCGTLPLSLETSRLVSPGKSERVKAGIDGGRRAALEIVSKVLTRASSAVVRAEFEEKQFELAMSVELADGRLGTVYSSGQVLEAIVGYDAVAQPRHNNPIWQILQVPRPAGLRLVPVMWAPGATPDASRLPASPVSLILQYKRPEYISRAPAKQWTYWRAPYFRFERKQPQHKILRQLESRWEPQL